MSWKSFLVLSLPSPTADGYTFILAKEKENKLIHLVRDEDTWKSNTTANSTYHTSEKCVHRLLISFANVKYRNKPQESRVLPMKGFMNREGGGDSLCKNRMEILGCLGLLE